MNVFRRPRLWVSLLLGIAAGLLVWSLPPAPAPVRTLKLPGADRSLLGTPFILHAVSPDARFLITFGSIKDQEPDAVHIWDTQRFMQEPVITVPMPPVGFGPDLVFSADGRTLAILVVGFPKSDLLVFDLASGRKLHEFKVAAQLVLFAPDGKLLYVEVGIDNPALRDTETGAEIRRLKPSDGYVYNRSLGENAIYLKGDHVRIVSWLTGEQRLAIQLPLQGQEVRALSHDGQVVYSFGWPGVAMPAKYQALTDTATGHLRTWGERDFGGHIALSPDGRYHAWHDLPPAPAPTWWSKWRPFKRADMYFHVTHWPTGEEVACFGDLSYLLFAHDGSHLVTMREARVIDIYDFPIRKPWGLIVGVGLMTAACTWGIAWLWSRRLNRPTTGSAVLQSPTNPPGSSR